jgi:uncharacterized integral membrane protein
VRNFWVYRRLIALAMLLGLLLWFIWANSAAVTVAFPFGLGSLNSTVGLVILLSALFGSMATALVFTVFFALRRRTFWGRGSDDDGGDSPLPDDRPPSDYAAKTEGFPDSRWS